MQVITNNPYRTIGILVGSSTRDQDRQVRQLKHYIEAEQEFSEDYSFPVLGALSRTIDSVSEASTKLNLNSDKIYAALFWFFNGIASSDEPAFNCLKNSDIKSAIEIWSKLVSSSEISEINNSAFQNLSTLVLYNSFNGLSVNTTMFEHGLCMKLKFLESDYVLDFIARATDKTFITSKKEIQLIFLNTINGEIEKLESRTLFHFIDILNKEKFSAKEEFLKGFAQNIIERIERKIDDTKSKRKADKANAYIVGKSLFQETSDFFLYLKLILDTSNLKYSSISDKVSNEILQCGIDHLSYSKDSDKEIGRYTNDLIEKAKTLAIGSIVIQRCRDTAKDLLIWIDNENKRKEYKEIEFFVRKIRDDIKRITDPSSIDSRFIILPPAKYSLIDMSIRYDMFFFEIKNCLKGCEDQLIEIKKIIKDESEILIELEDFILLGILKTMIEELNSIDSRLTIENFVALKMQIMNLLYRLDKLRCKIPTKEWYIKNRKIIMENYMISEIDLLEAENFDIKINTETEKRKNNSGACYIATMAYGDYNHPQVIILQQFRDSTLNKTIFGKWFIDVYYHYSPIVVEKLKSKRALNSIIRKALNQFIKIIK